MYDTLDNDKVDTGIPEGIDFRVETEEDYSPDLSYLGEFKNQSPRSGWYVDRVPATQSHRFVLGSNAEGARLVDADTGKTLASGLETAGWHELKFWHAGGNHTGNLKDWAHVKTKEVKEAYAREQDGLQRNDLRTDYVARNAMIRQLDILYCIKDYERHCDCGNGWSPIGVIVTMYANDMKIDEESVWGIESDSKDYIEEESYNLARELWNNRERNAEELRKALALVA